MPARWSTSTSSRAAVTTAGRVTERAVPRLFVETDEDAANATTLRFAREASDLLALLSFGVAEPFGSQHPLTQLVRRLKTVHGLDVGPLLTFYDRDVEDALDAVNLEAAWQEPGALGDCVAAVQAALAGDAEAGRLLAGYEAIPDLLSELGRMAATAAKQEARIRISFSLD